MPAKKPRKVASSSARKTTVKRRRSSAKKTANVWSPYSRSWRRFMVFLLPFAVIGAFLVIRSFAAGSSYADAICSTKTCYTTAGVVIDQNSAPVVGASLSDCRGHTVVTNSTGKYSFAYPKNTGYCVRLTAYPTGYTGPTIGYNNHPEHANAGSYEWQVIGAACYNNPTFCGAGKLGGSNSVLTWDMAPENNLNFKITKSTGTPPPPPPPPPAAGPCGVTSTRPATYKRVVWIWMENHSYSQVIGNANSPYQTALAHQCSSATNYANVGSPSLPNYIGATSGSTQGISDDNNPSSHVLNVDNIFNQARAHGLTAGSYEEAMSGNCAQSNNGSGLYTMPTPATSPSNHTYAVRHNPEAYYTFGNSRTNCNQFNVPMGSVASGNFLNAINADALPNFTFVTPDVCNDTHSPCDSGTAQQAGDNWLSLWIPKLLNMPSYKNGQTAVVLMYDESGKMPNTFMSISAKANYATSAAYNHFSLLRTTEEMLGLPLLGNANSAASMRADINM